MEELQENNPYFQLPNGYFIRFIKGFSDNNGRDIVVGGIEVCIKGCWLRRSLHYYRDDVYFVSTREEAEKIGGPSCLLERVTEEKLLESNITDYDISHVDEREKVAP